MSPSYVDSYYSRTLASSEAYPPADGPISTDICIVGGGPRGPDGGARTGAKRPVRRAAGGPTRRLGGVRAGTAASSRRATRRRCPPSSARSGRTQAEELYRLSIEGMEIVQAQHREPLIDEAAADPGNHAGRALRWRRRPSRRSATCRRRSSAASCAICRKEETRSLLQSPKYHAALLEEDFVPFPPVELRPRAGPRDRPSRRPDLRGIAGRLVRFRRDRASASDTGRIDRRRGARAVHDRRLYGERLFAPSKTPICRSAPMCFSPKRRPS